MKQINKFTLRELEKIQHLLPTNWRETTHFNVGCVDNIPKSSINVGDKFTIKIENYIINQPENFSLSENWNHGTVPPEEILDIEVLQLMGKMTKVKAVGKCTRIAWEGWLPNKSFKIQ